jgi:hypothetical protein
MKRALVSDDVLAKLVRLGRGTWRYTALEAAVQVSCGCSARTARRRIHEGVQAGIVIHVGSIYTDPARRDRLIGPNAGTQIAEHGNAPTGADDSMWEPASTLRTAPRKVDRRVLLLRLEDREWCHAALIDALCEWFDCSARTAQSNLTAAIAYGYLERHRRGWYRRTPTGAELTARYGRLEGVEGERFARYCSGRPGRFTHR